MELCVISGLEDLCCPYCTSGYEDNQDLLYAFNKEKFKCHYCGEIFYIFKEVTTTYKVTKE